MIVNIFIKIFTPHPENQIKLKIFKVNAHPYKITVVRISIYFIYSAPLSYILIHAYPHK